MGGKAEEAGEAIEVSERWVIQRDLGDLKTAKALRYFGDGQGGGLIRSETGVESLIFHTF
jgi:hypothetical protein